MYDTLSMGSGGDTATTPKERLIALRNFIAFLEDPEKKFDMRVWSANRVGDTAEELKCGTVHCIGGWAEVLFFNTQGNRYGEEVGVALGLRPDQAEALFYPEIEEEWADITSANAVKVLSHLIETGEVDWSIAGYTPQRWSQ